MARHATCNCGLKTCSKCRVREAVRKSRANKKRIEMLRRSAVATPAVTTRSQLIF